MMLLSRPLMLAVLCCSAQTGTQNSVVGSQLAVVPSYQARWQQCRC